MWDVKGDGKTLDLQELVAYQTADLAQMSVLVRLLFEEMSEPPTYRPKALQLALSPQRARALAAELIGMADMCEAKPSTPPA